MGSIKEVRNEWRDRMVPASFRNVVFHVEVSARQSGVRSVVHEYPKRDDPYTEPMGRSARRWAFTAYLVWNDKRYPSLLTQRRRLIDALELSEPGTMMHPTLGSMKCMCERYSVTETRERGGYFEFDMQFVEAGTSALTPFAADTSGEATQAAATAETSGARYLDNEIAAKMGVGIPPPDRPSGSEIDRRWPS